MEILEDKCILQTSKKAISLKAISEYNNYKHIDAERTKEVAYKKGVNYYIKFEFE